MNIGGFNINEKVVCVDDHFSIFKEFSEIKLPSKNQIYTVRDLVISPDTNKLALVLQEIINPKMHFRNGFKEPLFSLYHFKPLEQYLQELTEKDLRVIEREVAEKSIENLCLLARKQRFKGYLPLEYTVVEHARSLITGK